MLDIAEANCRCFVHGCQHDGVLQFGLGLAEELRARRMSVAVRAFLVYYPASYLTVLCDLLAQLNLPPGVVQSAYESERQGLSAATVTQSIGEGAKAEEMLLEDLQQTVVVSPTLQVVPWDAVVAAFQRVMRSACSDTKWVILCGITRECPTQEIQNVLRGAVWLNAVPGSSLRVVWCEENDSPPDWADAGERYRLGSIGASEAVAALQGEPARLSRDQAMAVVRQLVDESRAVRYAALESAVNNQVLRRSWT